MRGTNHGAEAPADRRLFDAGWADRKELLGLHSLMCAGLEVGRHVEEQF